MQISYNTIMIENDSIEAFLTWLAWFAVLAITTTIGGLLMFIFT